jgi:hypothetical protein
MSSWLGKVLRLEDDGERREQERREAHRRLVLANRVRELARMIEDAKHADCHMDNRDRD